MQGVMRAWLHGRIQQNIKGPKNKLWKCMKSKRNSAMRWMPAAAWGESLEQAFFSKKGDGAGGQHGQIPAIVPGEV